MKTDDPNLVGVHAFEKAGLGRAPFRCVGFSVEKYQACPGAPIQVGGSCAYCGTGIMDTYWIRGSEPGAKTFKVGSDCVRRTGDAGLIKSHKTHPAVRAAAKAKRIAQSAAHIDEWRSMMADEAKVAILTAARYGEQGERCWLDVAKFAYERCGAAGRKRWLKAAKHIINKETTP
jgi:hypothetical protein